MDQQPLKDTLADLYELLEQIEREHHALSPANRRKVTRAVCQVLVRERSSSREDDGARSPYARVYAPR